MVSPVCCLRDVWSDGNVHLIGLLPIVMIACALCVLHCVMASPYASFSGCFLPVVWLQCGIGLADMLWCTSRVRASAVGPEGGLPCLHVLTGDRHWSRRCAGPLCCQSLTHEKATAWSQTGSDQSLLLISMGCDPRFPMLYQNVPPIPPCPPPPTLKIGLIFLFV